MSKLFKLKKFLTLDDAANHISNVLGEPVTLADIYKFALDGDLILSVNFVNIVKAKKVTFIKKEDVKYRKKFAPNILSLPKGTYANVPVNAKYPISRECWLESIENKVVSLSEVWDLSMIGTEKFSIKQLYQQEISSDIRVKIPEAMSIYVKGAKGIYELQLLLTMEQYREQHNTPLVNGMRTKILDSALAYPASRLDELDHDLVVKVKEITRFIQSLEDAPQEDKPLHDKQRTTLLVLFASMLKKSNFDLDERGITGKIQRATESNNTPISEQTIRTLLPDVRSTVELKQKLK
jgi:hypothetical protein